MAQAFTRTRLPEPGVKCKRVSADKMVVYLVEVREVGEFERIQLPGRAAYKTADGKVHATAAAAVQHLTGGADE